MYSLVQEKAKGKRKVIEIILLKPKRNEILIKSESQSES
jgi:ribulose bisphosphate carboxylase small subunit